MVGRCVGEDSRARHRVVTALPWSIDRAAGVAMKIAAQLFFDRPECAKSASDIATEVGRASHRLESEAGFREMLHELLPWTCCEERVEQAVSEVYGNAPEPDGETHKTPARLAHERNELSRAIAEAAPKGGICNGEIRPTNVFLSPGGVEPEEWRSR